MQVDLAVLSRLGFAEKRKKIKLCAAHLKFVIGDNIETVRGSWPKEETREVSNPDLKSTRQQCWNSKSDHFYGEFDSGSE